MRSGRSIRKILLFVVIAIFQIQNGAAYFAIRPRDLNRLSLTSFEINSIFKEYQRWWTQSSFATQAIGNDEYWRCGIDFGNEVLKESSSVSEIKTQDNSLLRTEKCEEWNLSKPMHETDTLVADFDLVGENIKGCPIQEFLDNPRGFYDCSLRRMFFNPGMTDDHVIQPLLDYLRFRRIEPQRAKLKIQFLQEVADFYNQFSLDTIKKIAEESLVNLVSKKSGLTFEVEWTYDLDVVAAIADWHHGGSLKIDALAVIPETWVRCPVVFYTFSCVLTKRSRVSRSSRRRLIRQSSSPPRAPHCQSPLPSSHLIPR